MFDIFIKEKPQPKLRPRFNKCGGAYTPPKTKNNELIYKTLIKNEMNKIGVEMVEDILSIDMTFIYKSPAKNSLKGLSYKKTRPDVDNLAKLVLDAMNGIVYKDDSQVCKLSCEKIYGKEEGVYINIVSLED